MLTVRLLYLLLPREAGGTLSDREREVIVDYYLRGLTLSEVAELHGTTKSAAGQLVKSARPKLRQRLEEWDAMEEGLVAV